MIEIPVASFLFWLGDKIGGAIVNNWVSKINKGTDRIEEIFDEALEKTKELYFRKYDYQYGDKNDCFFDYQVVIDQLFKIVFVTKDPDVL